MSDYQELTSKLDELVGTMRDVVRVQNEARKADDGTRKAEALDAAKLVADQLTAADKARGDAALASDVKARNDEISQIVDEAVKAALRGTRAPSMADVIGQGTTPEVRSRAALAIPARPELKASLGDDYRAGELLLALQHVNGNPDEYAQGKAWFQRYGLARQGVSELAQGYGVVQFDQQGKATLGTTNATGGYVLPNNLVDTLVKPRTQGAVLQSLVTVRNGVNVRGVDQPYRLGAPTRATFQDWGATKTNVNESYGSYTAILGTLAVIYDISKQYARFSAGSAEQDVIDEIGKSMILGENYYMVAGASISGSVGSGDPTYGLYTALNAASSFLNYSKTPTTSASSSTLLGSFANILTQVSAQLAGRNRAPQAFLCDHTTYWTAAGQGSDTAGFWNAPEEGPTSFGIIPGFGRTPSGGLTYWGVPVYYDTNLGTNATTKIVIGGEFDALKLYRGMEFRIDTSDQAGTRWDQNLIGFRGEEEIGFHAGTAVNVGAFQMYTSVLP